MKTHYDGGVMLLVDPEFGTDAWPALPASLVEDLDGDTLPDDASGYDGSHWSHDETVELFRALHSRYYADVPYHGSRPSHGAAVMARTELITSALEAKLAADGVVLPPGLYRDCLLGALAHDIAHPGGTFFELGAPARTPRDVGVLLVEQYSAQLADAELRERNATLHTRLLVAYLILATCSARRAAPWRARGLPSFTVRGVLGLSVMVADVAPNGDPAVAWQEEVAITLGERAPVPPPQRLEELPVVRARFLDGLVEPRFEALDAAARYPITYATGLRAALGRHHAHTSQCSPAWQGYVRSLCDVAGANLPDTPALSPSASATTSLCGVIVVDLVDSSTWLGTQPSKVQFEFVASLRRVLVDAGGQLIQYNGDGFMFATGVPAAADHTQLGDEAVLACEAAATAGRMRDAFAEQFPHRDLCIGVDLGELTYDGCIVAGPVAYVASCLAQDRTAPTTNRVLLTARVGVHVADARELGERTIKGNGPLPVQVYEL